MRLGNAFRKGYSDAVDTSRRRRSENAELFNNYVKMNADMGAKVSAADLEGFKGSLSGGSSYFGAGLPSTDALQETSKRLGQIQSNKQTLAADNSRAKSLAATQTSIQIAQELSGQYMHTDFSDKEFSFNDGTTRMLPGGGTEYFSFKDQLREAGVNEDLFTREWFRNNAAMNQQQYALDYFKINGIDQITTKEGWEAASIKANQPWLKTRIEGMQDIFLDKVQKRMALTARTAVIDDIGVNYGDYDTQAKFLEAGLAAYNNSFTGGHTATDAQVKLMTDELNSIYAGQINGLIASDLSSIQQNLQVDLTTPEGIDAAFRQFYSIKGRDVTAATDEQKSAFVTKQRQMNAPRRLELAEIAFTATIEAVSKGQSAVNNRQRFADMTKEEAAEEVQAMLDANGIDYARMAPFDPNLRERHRRTLAARIKTVIADAVSSEETADTSALETFILTEGGEVQNLFKAQRLPDRKGQLFAILNNQKESVLGMKPYTRKVKTRDFDDDRPNPIPGVEDAYVYDAEFEKVFDRLDAAGNVEYLAQRAESDALASKTITEQITTQRDWWGKADNMISIIPGTDGSSEKMRSVAFTVGGQFYITAKQRQLIGPAIIAAFKALGIESEGELTPDDGTNAARIVAENLGLQSSANPSTIITNYITEQNEGIPEAGTYWDRYLEGEFETSRSLVLQMIAARITNQPITTDAKVIKKAAREILAAIETDKQDFRIGLDEDELRYTIDNNIPINGDVQYDNMFLSVIEMVNNAKPTLKPPYMTRVNREGEELYVMQTDNAIRIGTEDGYDHTKVYRLVDGALEEVADIGAEEVGGIGVPPPPEEAIVSADNRTQIVDGNLTYIPVPTEPVRPEPPNLPGIERANEGYKTWNDARAQKAEQLIQSKMTPEFAASITTALQSSLEAANISNFAEKSQWQQTEVPRIIADALKSAGLPFDEQSVAIAMEAYAGAN